MNRTLAIAASVLVLLPLLGCSKTNKVEIDPGEDAGNNDQSLPECPAASPPVSGKGPTLVHVGRLDGTCFWMDETEVTRGQYAAFLATSPGDAANVEACQGKNADFAPLQEVDLTQAQMPVSGIDWCDAAAFCKWADKALCGTYPVKGAAVSSFQSTCTDGDNGEFDYGALKDGSRCNGNGAAAAVEVRSMQACVTPTLVFDLVGNVQEWTSECEGAECAARGGSYLSTGESWGCKAKRSFPKDFEAADLGFRCCAEGSSPDAGQ